MYVRTHLANIAARIVPLQKHQLERTGDCRCPTYSTLCDSTEYRMQYAKGAGFSLAPETVECLKWVEEEGRAGTELRLRV